MANPPTPTSGTKTAWEEGLSVIDSVLEPGSATDQALTCTQREGLQRLKKLLLTGDSRRDSHIPQGLLKAADDESTPKGPCETKQYFLSEFGGIDQPVNYRKKLKSIITAQKFVRRLSLKAKPSFSLTNAAPSLGTLCPPCFEQLSPEKQRRLAELLSWESLTKWDFNIFEFKELLSEQSNALTYMGWAILGSPYAQQAMAAATDSAQKVEANDNQGYRFLETYKISEETLLEFLMAIQNEYLDVPYHNQYHASDVLQTLHTLLQLGSDVHRFVNDPIELFAILLAAVIHDVGHPGYNNSFQVNSKSDLALMYNDNSVLENMHAARAFELLMGKNKKSELDIFSGFSTEQATAVRSMVIKTVLHTDMGKHFHKVDQVKGLVLAAQEENKSKNETNGDDTTASTTSTISLKGDVVLGFLLHAADISNSAKPAPVFEQWTDRCLQEFFRQGDKERELRLPISPLCDRQETKRAASQIGFLKYIIQPTFQLLGKMIPQVATQIVPIIDTNLEFWQQQKALEEEKEADAAMQQQQQSTEVKNGNGRASKENTGPNNVEGEGSPRKKTKVAISGE